MKYIIRAIKYYIYFSLLCTVIIFALVGIGAVEGNIESIFKGGYNSIWQIAIFFALVAAVYPKLGFIQRKIYINKDWGEIREDVMEYMKERKYEPETEENGIISFRIRGLAGKLSKMYEDRISLTRTEDGYIIEGLRKDVLRFANGLEHLLTPHNEVQGN